MTPIPSRAILVYQGGHNSRDLGHPLPERKLKTNVKLDLQTSAGTRTVKRMMDAQLAWLLVEGMDLPVFVDPVSGLAVDVDVEALERELGDLEASRAAVDAAHREQTSLRYDLPTRAELASMREFPREVVRGLRDAWRRR